MNITIDPDRLARVPALRSGAHAENDGTAMCVMEAVAWVAREPWSDHPLCVCPVLGAFLRAWNDGLPDETRTALLKPLIPQLVNTRGSAALERRRATMAADWLVSEHTVAWLRLAKLDTAANALAALPEITDFAKCPPLMPALEAARKDGAAARDAAWDAARDAAWAAACDAREQHAEKEYEVGDDLIARLDEAAAFEKTGYRHDLLKEARDQIVRLAQAARLIDTFEWWSMRPDCREHGDEANRRIGCVRAALRGEDFTV